MNKRSFKVFKKLWMASMLFGLSFLMVLMLFEICLRIKRRHPKYVLEYSVGPLISMNSNLWYNRPSYSYKLKCKGEFSHTIYHNQYGHRVENINNISKKVSNTCKLKILCIGDSFTYGWGASNGNSYVSRLNALLNEAGEEIYEVINAGCPTYGLDEEIEYITTNLKELKSDIVIMNILANDLRDMIKGKERIKILNGRQLTKSAYSIALSKNPIISNLFIAQWICLKFKRIKYILSIINLFTKNSDRRKHLFNLALTKIISIKKFCEENGSMFILVYIPERDGRIFDKEFSDYLSQNYTGVLVNSYPLITSINQWKNLYYKKDKHFREQGYIILSEIVFCQLLPVIPTHKNKKTHLNIVRKEGYHATIRYD